MAQYYEIMVCTGFDHAAAERVLAGMRELPHPWTCASVSAWDIPDHLQPTPEIERPLWWAHLVPRGLSYAAPADQGYFVDGEAERQRILDAVEARLVALGGFLVAAFGFELNEDTLYQSLRAPPADFDLVRGGIPLHHRFIHCDRTLLSDAWWQDLGRPAGFRVAAPGLRVKHATPGAPPT